MNEHTCVNCGRSSDEAPLLNMIFKGDEKYIWAPGLSILILSPFVLAVSLYVIVRPLISSPEVNL